MHSGFSFLCADLSISVAQDNILGVIFIPLILLLSTSNSSANPTSSVFKRYPQSHHLTCVTCYLDYCNGVLAGLMIPCLLEFSQFILNTTVKGVPLKCSLNSSIPLLKPSGNLSFHSKQKWKSLQWLTPPSQSPFLTF